MLSAQTTQFSTVYGPVKSWRFGRSLGIDPIGLISTCSFNCVYCQLGEIQKHTTMRQIFVHTAQILQELQAITSWDGVDVVTLSGSGEPTLALNLGDILAVAKRVTGLPTVVLTNSTLLGDPSVRSDLSWADMVAVKLDAVSSKQLLQVNRPVAVIDLPEILAKIELFRQEYQGFLAIQTMLLSPWSAQMQAEYIQILQRLNPDEIQLNTPSRPRSLRRNLNNRGNEVIIEMPEHGDAAELVNFGRQLKCVSADVLQGFAAKIQTATNIPVRYAPIPS
jgi:wyosine [tRNA(Phe)-imidazoG37] synthetase (radical SAM superfamily)